MEEVRFESVERSLHACQRAKQLRMLVILIVLAVAVVRIGFPNFLAEVVSTPVLMGVLLMLSTLTFSVELASRWRYLDAVNRYESLVQADVRRASETSS
jgi:hypothetical protein